jgi:hypothetical protein
MAEYYFPEYVDLEVDVPKHKHISDVLPVIQALKSNKSSKNCKIKPRSIKRDKTKTREAKSFSKHVRCSHSEM